MNVRIIRSEMIYQGFYEWNHFSQIYIAYVFAYSVYTDIAYVFEWPIQL